MSNYNINGCMIMFGAAIRLAIMDFKAVHKHHKSIENKFIKLSKVKRTPQIQTKYGNLMELLRNYETSNHFLFSKNGLEDFIEVSGLPLNIDYVRRISLKSNDEFFLRKNCQARSNSIQEKQDIFFHNQNRKESND